jgi:hypothetical protein
MRYQVFPLEMPESIFELHHLDEQIVFRVHFGSAHRTLEIEGKPLLHSFETGPLGEVHEKNKVQYDGGGQDGVATQKIHLNLHRIIEPAENIDVVPALLVVSARGVVVYPDLVIIIFV